MCAQAASAKFLLTMYDFMILPLQITVERTMEQPLMNAPLTAAYLTAYQCTHSEVRKGSILALASSRSDHSVITKSVLCISKFHLCK